MKEGCGLAKRGGWCHREQVKRTLAALALVLCALLIRAGAQQGLALGELRSLISQRYPTVRWVDTETLARWLARPPAERPVLLDAREEAEFEVSHIEGAVRIDPDAPNLARVPRTEREIVVYCSVGYRSAAVAQKLMEAGRRRVYNLEGGIFGWAGEGRPLVSRGRSVRRVHPYDAVWGRLLDPALHSPL